LLADRSGGSVASRAGVNLNYMPTKRRATRHDLNQPVGEGGRLAVAIGMADWIEDVIRNRPKGRAHGACFPGFAFLFLRRYGRLAQSSFLVRRIPFAMRTVTRIPRFGTAK